MSDDATRQTNFANMSAVLTGFTTDVVNPLFDPLQLVPTYLATADAKAGAALVDALTQQFLSLTAGGATKQQIADTMLDTGNTAPGNQALLARAIVKMWYLGSWYSSPTDNNPTVVSQNAYIGGLAWKAMQAHPMGFSDFTFGYWVTPPPSLADFGVDLPSGGQNG
jgi:hypothetical protein